MKKIFTILTLLLFVSISTFGQTNISKNSDGVNSKPTFLMNGQKAILLTQDFEGTTFPPTGWTVVNFHASATSNWNRGESDDATNHFANIEYTDADMMQERLITPSINLVGQPAAYFNFAFSTSYYWFVDPENGADLKVEVSTDGGTNWTTIWTEVDYGVFENWTWYNVSLPLTAYLGQSNVKLSFYYVGNDGAQAMIDNVIVSTTVGINESAIATSVYPNPASDFVTFAAQENINKVEVYNVVGQLIYSNNETNNQVMVNVKDFSNGVYIAKLFTNSGTSTQKFNVVK